MHKSQEEIKAKLDKLLELMAEKQMAIELIDCMSIVGNLYKRKVETFFDQAVNDLSPQELKLMFRELEFRYRSQLNAKVADVAPQTQGAKVVGKRANQKGKEKH